MSIFRTKLERKYIKKRLDGNVLSPVRSLPTKAFPIGRPFAVTTDWNVRGSNPPWSLERHTGEDYACPTGMRAVSTCWGTVVWAGTYGGWSSKGTYGLHVIVRTGDGNWDAMWAHLSSARVRVGDKVRPGTVLGKTGATGNVSGPHVHFEVRPAGGGFGSDVDPRVVRQAKRDSLP
jgi:murein DD-endopeptidase MepM/ murein hydrolase activator NlpD